MRQLKKDVREPTQSFRKPRQEELFLSALAQGFSVTHSASVANVSRASLYRWGAENDEFKAKWLDAAEQSGDWFADRLREAAASGSVPAIIVGLKMKRLFTEHTEVSGRDGDPIQIQSMTTVLQHVIDGEVVSTETIGGTLPAPE
jgi:predicted transcriptional regulator